MKKKFMQRVKEREIAFKEAEKEASISNLREFILIFRCPINWGYLILNKLFDVFEEYFLFFKK